MINLTNNAIERLKGFLEPDNIVRLSIQGGGCAGFEYKFGVQPKEDAYEDDTMYLNLYNPWRVDGRPWDDNPQDGLLIIDMDLVQDSYTAAVTAMS